MGALSLFSCNYTVPSGGGGRQWHQSMLLMSSLLHNLVLVAVTAENSASQRQDVGNGSRLFGAFMATSGYSSLTLIQNVWRFEVVSNMLLRPPSLATSSSWFCSSTKSIHMAYSQMGRGSIASQSRVFCGWEVCSHSSESWDRCPCTSWEGEGPRSVSFKISASVWNMSNIPMFTGHPHNSSVALNAATLSANLNTVVILPWSDRSSSLSRLNMSYK